jgi:hypothetical protein
MKSAGSPPITIRSRDKRCFLVTTHGKHVGEAFHHDKGVELNYEQG